MVAAQVLFHGSTRRKEVDMKENNRRALGRVAWVGRAARFCLGLLAVLALIVAITVLTAVMLAATILPPASAGRRRDPGYRRGGEKASEPRKMVAS